MSFVAALLLLAQAGAADVPKATSIARGCDSPRDYPEETICAARDDDSDECDDPQTQQQVDACAAHDFAAAEARLDEQWQETVAEMKRLDGELPAGGDGQPGYYATLVEAQRVWLAYRDAECRSEGFLMRGTPAQPTVELQCKAYLTEVRTQQLVILVSGLDL